MWSKSVVMSQVSIHLDINARVCMRSFLGHSSQPTWDFIYMYFFLVPLIRALRSHRLNKTQRTDTPFSQPSENLDMASPSVCTGISASVQSSSLCLPPAVRYRLVVQKLVKSTQIEWNHIRRDQIHSVDSIFGRVIERFVCMLGPLNGGGLQENDLYEHMCLHFLSLFLAGETFHITCLYLHEVHIRLR